ncbi:hypothetical protein M728_005281 (plasmid) [Ensifer sp. WSM1721]|uniref:C45 family autoproteolytic acyltransferase/hydolase n=1 Tax=Ensifer sp. WSM1721 TaxID=1041159 RepID=UPI0018DB4CE0|nr:C45 family peptidase [Ensifer sp. WSM1721]
MCQANSNTHTNLPVVILSGTAFQRGVQHGRKFADRIAAAIAKMKSRCSPANFRVARGYALRSWTELQGVAPALVEEISGIAQGAKCDTIDLYCHIGFEFFDAPPPGGCSGMAIASPTGALLGQNWDAPPQMHEDLALFLHLDDAGVALAMVGSIGTLGWVGQNRCGLALLTNDLMLDNTTTGFPSQVVRRLVLDQRDVLAALDKLRQLPIMGGRCYLLGDSQGNIAAVELSPAAGVCVAPPGPRIFHTNNALLKPTRAVQNENQLQVAYPSSRSRLAALEDVGKGAITVADLMAALRDRTGAPDSVSKTISNREQTSTAFSVIFDCSQHALFLCGGPPSDGNYQFLHWPVELTEAA